MRHCYYLLIFFCSFTKLYSKDVKEYIVTLKGDTVSAQIKVPGGLFRYNANKKVIIIDNTGEKTLTPGDIRGYGCNYKLKDHVYTTRPIKNGSSYFLEPVIIGQKISLYEYAESDPKNTQYFYTFEKTGGTYVFLTNYSALATFKEKLKLLFQENAEIQKLIDKKFEERRHIQDEIAEILNAVNKS